MGEADRRNLKEIRYEKRKESEKKSKRERRRRKEEEKEEEEEVVVHDVDAVEDAESTKRVNEHIVLRIHLEEEKRRERRERRRRRRRRRRYYILPLSLCNVLE